jgi:hypothetical protein
MTLSMRIAESRLVVLSPVVFAFIVSTSDRVRSTGCLLRNALSHRVRPNIQMEPSRPLPRAVMSPWRAAHLAVRWSSQDSVETLSKPLMRRFELLRTNTAEMAVAAR